MKLRIYSILFLLCFTIYGYSQRRQLQEARVIIKSGKDFGKAEKLMTDLLKDSVNQNNMRIYDLWLQSVEKQYEQVNEQMYKKQPVDTTSLFSLTRRIFMIGERLDSIDMLPDKKGRVNLQYREDNAERLNTYRPNLFFGGTYHLRKNEFKKAFDFFEHYIDCDRQPLFSGYDYLNNDPRMSEAAYWATYCGYRLQDPVLTLRYAKMARRDSSKLEYTLQYATDSWAKLKDDSSYVATLYEGFRHFPKSGYFFPRIIDYYSSKGNYENALAVANEALSTDSLYPLFMLVKSTMLLNLGRNEECLDYSQRLIDVDSRVADAYYNAGTACLNLSLNMDSRIHKKQIRKIHQRALPYMEAYRRLAPQSQQKWAPALYRIYFNLNMGKQFDEIDKILKK